MKLHTISSNKLDWSLNFRPLTPWPTLLPVLMCKGKVLTGFERQNQVDLDVLEIEGEINDLLKQLWPLDSLGSFERLRFLKATSEFPLVNLEILDWPLEFQNYLDQKQVPLKNLKPLKYLMNLKTEVSDSILKFKPTTAQIREIIELICDLQLSEKPWALCLNESILDADQWLQHLKNIRFPQTIQSDTELKSEVKNISWPKGVQARWERQGDQAGLVVSARVFSNHEWSKIRDGIQNIELSETIWTQNPLNSGEK